MPTRSPPGWGHLLNRPRISCAFDGQSLALSIVHVEDYLLEAWTRRKVEMEKGFLCAFQRVNCLADKFLATWREDLQPDIIRHYAWCLHELPCKVEVGLRR